MSPTLAPPDPRAVRAWRVYAERLRGLGGAEYEQAEPGAWDLLRAALAELGDEDERAGPRGVLG